ncbi:hypothetical protein LFL96_21275 [Paraburkholderia sp. D15]|uniref:glycine-rich domain-containing protein n=1 Tax=Paraburkholderia sp. D15 TaxID=2880218 RepID=UPI002478576E|nr:hypothetical protein [Paraburkholderia sp. D15]WGS53592.1 hypothetical protein LFL96_21275 [Paraburkholderia sp. D15]
MDRATVYTQEQGRSVDFLFAQRATMIGLGKLAQAIMGGNTMVRGLPVAPNSPAALNVVVGIGEIYSLAQVDATAWGALPADTTDFIVKQGLNMAAQTIATPAPTTGGYSIAYLIEAQYQDQDTNPAVLPFYNSANPQQPLNGQGGNGAAQATERQGVCVIQAKAGIAAPTGTQITPTVDAGWTALAVVTVAFGQTSVVSGNITVPAGVPQLTNILQMMQTESTNYAVDTSTTPNQISIALTPPITSYTDGMQLNFRAANNSSGAVNINAGPGNVSLSGAAGALQSGEIVSGGYYTAVYQSNTGTAVLVGQGAGAEQINPATQSKHAVQLQQAQAMRGTYNGSYSYSTSQALTAAQVGSEIIFFGTSAGTFSMPQGSTISQGSGFSIVNASVTAVLTVALFSGDQALSGGSVTPTSISLQPGDDLEITRSGAATQWIVTGSAIRQFNPLVVAAATASTHALQLQQAQAMRGTFNGAYAYNSSQTLTTAQVGAIINFYGTTAGAFAVPQGSTVAQGNGFYILNVSTAVLTINLFSGDQALPGGGATPTSIAMQPGDDLEITRSTVSTQWLVGGSCIREFNPLSVAAATAGQHAMQFQQAIGRLINVQTFAAAGTFTYTPSAGTNSVVVDVHGGGGGGGSVVSTGASQVAASAGGGGGGFAQSRLLSGFSGASVIVGAAGPGGTTGGGAGGSGGSSSFGALLSATGGGAGAPGAAVANTASSMAPGGQGGTGTGGNLINRNGVTGGNATTIGTSIGRGAGGPTGGGISSGGDGLQIGSSVSAGAGINGQPGYVRVWEYA